MITRKNLPASVCQLTQNFSAWIVGSTADPKRKSKDITDIDVVVPFENWSAASALIPSDAKKNTYGGWSYEEKGLKVDVWPCSLNDLMCNSYLKYLWQPKYNIRYVKQ